LRCVFLFSLLPLLIKEKFLAFTTVVFLVLYVDNIFLIGNDVPMLQLVKR